MTKVLDIAGWVKAARTHGELTQDQLGERLGVTKGNVSGWENGRHEPSYRQLLQISAMTRFPMPGLREAQVGAMDGLPDAPIPPREMIELITLYGRADGEGRKSILDMARANQIITDATTGNSHQA